MAVDFKVEYVDADNARVRAFDAEDGSLIEDTRVKTQHAEALAVATLAARDAFRAEQGSGLNEGARVLVGNDPVVRSEYYGQEGTIAAESWMGSSEVKVILFDDGREQIAHNDYLTVVTGAEDADAAQEQVFRQRLAEEGVRVKVAADAKAFLKNDGNEPTGGVFFGGEVEATIREWPPNDRYCGERNFYVENGDGVGQMVAIRDTEPLDDEDAETVSTLTREVGAEYATRRGIVPGATVNLPWTSLEGALFGTGEVLTVEDGMVTVDIHDVTEQTYPAFILTTADDDG